MKKSYLLLLLVGLMLVLSMPVSAELLSNQSNIGTLISTLDLNGEGIGNRFNLVQNATLTTASMYCVITNNPTIAVELWNWNEATGKPTTRLHKFESRNGLSTGWINFTNATGYNINSSTNYSMVSFCESSCSGTVKCSVYGAITPAKIKAMSYTADNGNTWAVYDDNQIAYALYGTNITSSSSDNKSMSVNLVSPATGYVNNSLTNGFYYNVTWYNTTLSNCSLYTNQSGWAIRATNTTAISNNTNTAFSYSLPSEGTYLWNVGCWNSTTNEIFGTSNWTIITDTTAPTITTNFTNAYTLILPLNVTTTDANPKNITIIDNCNINFTNTSITSNPYSYIVSMSTKNCSLGNKQTNITVCDNGNNCNSSSFTWYNSGQLNITAKNNITGAYISNFSIYLNTTLLGTTTTGNLSLSNFTAGTFALTIDADGYAYDTQNITISNTTNSYLYNIFATNSINIHIYDEVTNVLITTVNISIKFTNNITSWINVTSNGILFISNLTPANYTLQFYTLNGSYGTRTYTITVGNKTTQNLDAYMISSANSAIFTVLDNDVGTSLDNVLFNIYKQSGATWVAVQSSYTDITGKVQFYYDPIGSYRFYLTYSNYNDLIFYLNPILFSTYDVKMTKNSTVNWTTDFNKLSITYSPHSFINDHVNSFSWVIGSPDGLLTNYGITLTYPGGSNSTTGVNAIGGQLNLNAYVTGATAFDTVKLDYYYITTLSGLRNFTVLLPITGFTGYLNNTMISNQDNTYGLGIFERVLVTTLVVIFVVGIATLVGQLVAGFALGLLVLGFMTYIGFIPLWIVLPTLFVGVIFVVWKGGGY